MPLTGSIYEEAGKFGFAKLLNAQVFTGAGAVNFTIPTTHDTFVFSIDNLYSVNGAGILLMHFMRSGVYRTDNWWSNTMLYSNYAVVRHSSQDSGMNYFYLSQNDQGGHPLTGHIKLFANNVGGVEHALWRLTSHGTYPFANYGGGFVAEGGRSDQARFLYSTGTMTGTIRLYGMRTGA